MRHSQAQPRIHIEAKHLRRVINAHQKELHMLQMAGKHESIQELLAYIIRLGIRAIQAETNTCSFKEAAERSLEARKNRRPATLHDLRYFIRRMLKEPGLAERPLRAMTTQECRELLERAFSNSLHSFKKGRAILHSIFSFGIRREWCEKNPVDNIEIPTIQEKDISPLSLKAVQQLEKTCKQQQHRDMLLSLRLMLYCGLRPAEVMRLNPRRDIDWGLCHVLVRPRTSKTGGGRLIPLRAVARVQASDRVIPPQWTKRWRDLRRAAGIRYWQPDACRHTFASYHAAHFHNLQALQMEMGHSDASLLFSRYMVPIPPQQAKAFWKEHKIRLKQDSQ